MMGTSISKLSTGNVSYAVNVKINRKFLAGHQGTEELLFHHQAFMQSQKKEDEGDCNEQTKKPWFW